MKKTQTIMDNLTCESCGKPFECGAKLGKCWCFEVDVNIETLDELKENFERCLCPKCLEEKKQPRINTN